MKIHYHESTDTLLFCVGDSTLFDEADLGQGVAVHVTESGQLVGIRISQASSKIRIDEVRRCTFQWHHDPDSLDFDRLLDGPWIQDKIGLERFNEYIDALRDHLPTVCAQHRLRAERTLDKDIDGMPKDVAREYWSYRSQQIDDAVEIVIPSVAWSSAFLTIWSAFERALTKIVEYLETTEPAVVGHRDLAGSGNFGKLVRYLSKVAPIGPPWAEGDSTRLTQLYKIRNLFSHKNGILDTAKPKEIESMSNEIRQWDCSISEDGEIEASEKFVRRALSFLDARLNDLNVKCRARYGIG